MRIYFNGPKAAFLKNPDLTRYIPIDPSQKSAANVDNRQLKVQFGDGYQQRAPDGINNLVLSFDLSFDNRSEIVVKNILNFLQGTDIFYQRNQTEAFFWTPPPPFDTNGALLFTYDKLKHNWGEGLIASLSVTFNQVFEL